MVWTVALSVAEQVERVGAYVGFASFFGLAALTILYFAQAREMKRLRDWAGRAPERAREIEERLAAQAETASEAEAVAAAPAEQEAVAAPAVALPAVALVAAAIHAPAKVPAGVGAGVEAPAGEGAEGDGVATPAEAGASGAAPAVAAPAADGAPPAAPQAPDSPAPPAAAPTNGDAPADSPTQADVPTPNGRPTEQRPPALPAGGQPAEALPAAATVAARQRAAGSFARAQPLRAPAASATAPPRRPAPGRRPVAPPASPGSHRTRNVILTLLVAVLVAGAGAFAITQLGGDDEPLAPNTAGTPLDEEAALPAEESDGSSSQGASATSRAARGETVVSVLNGTTSTGLAASILDTLVQAGWDRGTAADNSDQQLGASTVLFARGHRAQAREIARTLRISDIRALDSDTQRLGSGDKVAEVVVIAGADQTP